MKKTRYIFVTGGVSSSLGKGIAASALGALLETYGYTITLAKIDPYLNLDAGTMSPIEHGEVYVTKDGAETDLDLGNYARFTTCTPTKKHSITTGQIYKTIIQQERAGNYLGKCVQMIPHVTDQIKQRIKNTLAPNTDIAIIEIGGTVGDIESTIFLESIRQLINQVGKQYVTLLHVTLIPTLPGDKELKTKPTQHAVQKFKEIVGMQPDILLCRLQGSMHATLKEKIALFTHIPQQNIIPATNFTHSIYEIPLAYQQQGLSQAVLHNLQLQPKTQNTTAWHHLMKTIINLKHTINIGIVGKYLDVPSSYTSIYEALQHAGFHHQTKINLTLLNSETLTQQQLHTLHAILIPGGFGVRGILGKILATQYAREKKIPFLGICLGLQILVIEYATHVAKLPQANSKEFDPNTPYPVIHLLHTQTHIQDKGGTMRLGTYPSHIIPNTLLAQAYHPAHTLYERHRHRYEINNQYLPQLTQQGLIISSTTQLNGHQLVEAVEWPQHPFGIGVQFHPEFQSTPFQPHPLFSAFVKASLRNR